MCNLLVAWKKKIADLQSWGRHTAESVLLDSIYVTIRIQAENEALCFQQQMRANFCRIHRGGEEHE